MLTRYSLECRNASYLSCTCDLSVCSTLTLGILREKYLVHVGRDSLSAEHRQLLKQIVEEELLKMQVGISSVFDGLHILSVVKGRTLRLVHLYRTAAVMMKLK